MRKLREKRGWSNRTQLSIGRGREVSFFILFRGLFLLFFFPGILDVFVWIELCGEFGYLALFGW